MHSEKLYPISVIRKVRPFTVAQRIQVDTATMFSGLYMPIQFPLIRSRGPQLKGLRGLKGPESGWSAYSTINCLYSKSLLGAK